MVRQQWCREIHQMSQYMKEPKPRFRDLTLGQLSQYKPRANNLNACALGFYTESWDRFANSKSNCFIFVLLCIWFNGPSGAIKWQGSWSGNNLLWSHNKPLLETMCTFYQLQWRHNGLDGVSNHQPRHCLLNRLFGRRSKKTSKLPRHWSWRIPHTNGQ